MTLVEPQGKIKARWPRRAFLAGAGVVLLGALTQLNEIVGHWLVLSSLNPYWVAAVACFLFAAAPLLGLRRAHRRIWRAWIWRGVVATGALLLCAWLALFGWIDHSWYRWHVTQRLDAPGPGSLRAAVYEGSFLDHYWIVTVESGHGPLTRRFDTACFTDDYQDGALVSLAWTGPRQLRMVSDADGTFTATVGPNGRLISPIPREFGC